MLSTKLDTERRLVLLQVGTEERRRAVAVESAELLRRADPQRLLRLLEHLRVEALVGERLLGLPVTLPTELENRLSSILSASRQWGRQLELVTLAVVAQLEKASIRVLPMKGATLARQLHGDPGLRSSADIDLLVSADDLARAAAVIEESGWRLFKDPNKRRPLPDLHDQLFHPQLPAVELHWRVHWRETQFAADALARAYRRDSNEPLRMESTDEIASLLLFYSREGFSGLRYPADIAAWWSAAQPEHGGQLPLDAIADQYPSLVAPIQMGSAVLERLIGVPAWNCRRTPARWRITTVMANPFLYGVRPQLVADRALVDVLLSSNADVGTAIGRHLVRIPRPYHQTATPTRPWHRRRVISVHAFRVVARWVLRLLEVSVRAITHRSLIASSAPGSSE